MGCKPESKRGLVRTPLRSRFYGDVPEDHGKARRQTADQTSAWGLCQRISAGTVSAAMSDCGRAGW